MIINNIISMVVVNVDCETVLDLWQIPEDTNASILIKQLGSVYLVDHGLHIDRSCDMHKMP